MEGVRIVRIEIKDYLIKLGPWLTHSLRYIMAFLNNVLISHGKQAKWGKLIDPVRAQKPLQLSAAAILHISSFSMEVISILYTNLRN